jgi:hypothetical protein
MGLLWISLCNTIAQSVYLTLTPLAGLRGKATDRDCIILQIRNHLLLTWIYKQEKKTETLEDARETPQWNKKNLHGILARSGPAKSRKIHETIRDKAKRPQYAIRAERREMPPATPLHASHAHDAQQDARHDAAHILLSFSQHSTAPYSPGPDATSTTKKQVLIPGNSLN